MKTYRFISKSCQDVRAETLEEAIDVFNEMKRGGRLTPCDAVVRIEVKDEEGEYVPVDRPLRAGDLEGAEEAKILQCA